MAPVTHTLGGRCAVVVNPTKTSDQFRDLMEGRLLSQGWTDTLWLETSVEDPGRAMTQRAIAEHVDLVVAAGGDGTVRVVADALAHSGIPMGLIPAGTGNLLARNLDLPLTELEAIDVALGGHTHAIDLVKIIVDDRPPEHFAVMAGIGVDAVIMDETDDTLKDKIGSAAYFVAAGKALGRLPLRITVQLDNHRPVRRRAMLCAIGNVGTLRGNLTLIPGARPDDGLLDLFIASPRRFHQWIKLALRLVTRRAKKDDQVDQRTGKRVRIKIHGKDNYQLDGDVVGESTTLTAEIQPGALRIRIPAVRKDQEVAMPDAQLEGAVGQLSEP